MPDTFRSLEAGDQLLFTDTPQSGAPSSQPMSVAGATALNDLLRDGATGTVDNAAVNAAIAEDAASSLSAIGAASSAIQSHRPDNNHKILVHDNCTGDFAALALNTDRTVYPGPGFARIRNVGGADSRLIYDNGAAVLTSVPGSAVKSSAYWTPVANTGVAAVAGLAFIARMKPYVGMGVAKNAIIGMDASGAGLTQSARGTILIISSAALNPLIYISKGETLNGVNTYYGNDIAIQPDEEVGLMIWYKSLTDIRYGIQCRAVANLGCELGSDVFFPLGRTHKEKQMLMMGIATACSSNGNLDVIVTSVDVAGSPVTYSVPMTTAADTAFKVAQTIATYLNNQASFNASWEAEGLIATTRTHLLIRRKVAAYTDLTADFQIVAGLGVTTIASWMGILQTHAYETHAGSGLDLTGLTVWPGLAQQNNGSIEITDVKLLQNYVPSGRSVQFGYDRGKNGVHIPSLAKDPVTGMVIVGYNDSITHVSTNSEIHGAVRRTDGSWTDEQLLVGRSPGDAIYQNCIASIGEISGQLYVFYFRNITTGAEGGPLYYRTITIDSVTGVVSMGAETYANIPSDSDKLFFAPPVVLSTGRIIMPYHNNAGISGAAYSDDNMATWTNSNMNVSGVRYEPTVIVESDGALGCWMRAAASAYYSRSTDNGVTWSVPVIVPAIPQPGGSGVRMRALRRSDGSMWLAGNDDRAVREQLKIWSIGDNGKVLSEGYPLIAPTPAHVSGVSLQYVDIIEDDDDMIISFSNVPAGGTANSSAINVHAVRWPRDPVALMAGGSGKRGIDARDTNRPVGSPSWIASAATITPDMRNAGRGDIRKFFTILGHNMTLNPPTNGIPWEVMEFYISQAASGGPFTFALGAGWDSHGITTTMSTTASETNTLRAIYSQVTGKWTVVSFA